MSKNNPRIDAELLTAAQASAITNMGERTWWRFVSSGRAPAPIKIGRVVRWKKKEIMEWIDAGCPRAPRPRRGH